MIIILLLILFVLIGPALVTSMLVVWLGTHLDIVIGVSILMLIIAGIVRKEMQPKSATPVNRVDQLIDAWKQWRA